MDNSTPTQATAMPGYVDTYTPPAAAPAPTPVTVAPMPDATSAMPTPQVTQPAGASMSAPATPAIPVAPMPAPAPVSSMPSSAQPTSSAMSQSLEDQNIFFLLGVTNGTDQEKESFLDELQQVIWEDFLENDVELLITEEEMTELKGIMAQKEVGNLELQEKIIVFLEKLIPDLEEIMLEKALELKEDMARERVAGMREYFASDATKLAGIDAAEKKMNDGQWRDAAQMLNTL